MENKIYKMNEFEELNKFSGEISNELNKLNIFNFNLESRKRGNKIYNFYNRKSIKSNHKL